MDLGSGRGAFRDKLEDLAIQYFQADALPHYKVAELLDKWGPSCVRQHQAGRRANAIGSLQQALALQPAGSEAAKLVSQALTDLKNIPVSSELSAFSTAGM